MTSGSGCGCVLDGLHFYIIIRLIAPDQNDLKEMILSKRHTSKFLPKFHLNWKAESVGKSK